ncbi:MAG: ABC transporter permease, partial [Burkholderiaceae bacterium]|nr:ABC transporter permease [Burkholderiaceae bacterium]
PLEILPFVALLSAMFHGLVSLAVWLLAYLILFGLPHLTVLYLPLVLVPLFMFIMGLSWALSSLGVFLRDIAQFIGVITTVLAFLSPVFYPVIEQTRDVLFWGKPPEVTVLGISCIASIFIAWLGFSWFQKTRKGFADVL